MYGMVGDGKREVRSVSPQEGRRTDEVRTRMGPRYENDKGDESYDERVCNCNRVRRTEEVRRVLNTGVSPEETSGKDFTVET